MKKLLIFLLCLVSTYIAPAVPVNYYFANNGNDAAAGTLGAPWRTIVKANTIIAGAGIAVGDDSILFKRGDLFNDAAITVGKSGTSGHAITLGAYGTGIKPLISGFTPVTAWTSLGSGIYESTSAVSALTTMGMVTLDGVDIPMGRFPKTGYFTYQSGINGSITSSGIAGVSSFVGGEVYVRFNRWSADRCVITAQSSSVVTYTPQSGFTPTASYGFFFQAHPNTLTQVGTTLGEWYYDPATKKIRMYFGGSSPGSYTVKVSSVDKLVTVSSKNYITFDNLALEGGNTNAFYITSGTSDVIQNCNISFTGKNAIEAASNTSLIVNGNYIDYSHTAGIEAGFQTTGATIVSNNVRHTAMKPGMTWKKTNDDILNGIRCQTAGSNIQYNTVFAAGFMGIRAHVSNGTTVQNNYVDSTCFVKDDGGGIYTWASGSSVHSNFQILNNIVFNSIGAPAGTSSSTPEGEGIYLDDNSDHVTVRGNTVVNTRRGIFLHNTNNIIVNNNTTYNNQYGLRTTMDGIGANVSLNITKNNFFAYSSGQSAAYFKSTAGTLNFGTVDSNYYSRPILETTSITTDLANVITNRTLAGWQTFSSEDANSNVTGTPVSNVSNIRFEYNATNASVDIPLSEDYIGVDNTSYTNSVTLAPYKSIILLTIPSSGNTYYFASSTGDDSRTSTQAKDPATPWRTLGKLNSYFGSLVAGDNALLKRGDTWTTADTATIIIGKSGNAGVPIIIGAYGTGAKPVVTSLVTVSGWTETALNSHLWRATVTGGPTVRPQVVLVNGVMTAPGRTPNATDANGGYRVITAAVGSTLNTACTVSDNTLGLTTNAWVGGELVLRSTDWQIDRSPITANTASTITYTNSSGNGTAVDYGFFVQHLLSTLDVPGEWYYNPSTKLITMYYMSNPGSAVKVAARTNLLTSISKSNVDIKDIRFYGSNGDAISLATGSDIRIIDCITDVAGITGIKLNGSKRTTLLRDTITNSLTTAVRIISNAERATVMDSYIRNTAQIKGLMQTDGNNANAITIDASCDTVNIEGNSIINSGGSGVNFRQSNFLTVVDNLIDTFCTTINDIGGIYCYQGATALERTMRAIVRGNMIRNGMNPKEGTPAWNRSSTDPFVNSTFGAYWDNFTSDIEFYNNHIEAGGKANMFFHLSSHDINVHDNTFYNPSFYQVYVKRSSTENVYSSIIKHNVFFSKGTQRHYKFYAYGGTTLPTLGVVDSNYFVNLNTNSTPWSAISSTAYNYAGWKTATGFDLHSDTTTYASTGTVRTDINVSSNPLILNLNNYEWKEGIKVGHSSSYVIVKTLPPYGSWVAIRGNAVAANISPVANAGVNRTITTPSTSLTITGSATDADGTVTDHVWTKYSGVGGSIVSPTNYSTSVTGLTAGIYVFTLTATDDRGGSHSDNMQVTVNVAPVANAGADVTVTLPTSTATLTATDSDADGTIVTRWWSQASGNAATLTTPAAASTGITGLTQGTYTFDYSVTDNSGSTTVDQVTVTVYPSVGGNHPPVANAGADQAITLPTSTITLSGSGTDDDGTIATYLWTKVTGGAGTITASGSASTTVTGLDAGNYTFRLRVTDNLGSSVYDDMIVTVATAPPTNISPTVSITSPPINTTYTANTVDVSLAAIAADADGTITHVEFYRDGVHIHTEYTSPYTYIDLAVTPGSYVYTARAYDNSTATTTSVPRSITILSPDAYPTVTLTAPADGQTYVEGATIVYSATATDNVSVSRVEFYKDDILVSTDVTAPYTASLFNVATGTYVLTARAVDNLGQSTTSNGVAVIVGTPVVSVFNFLTFTGTKVSPTKVTLNWAVDGPQTVKYFSVQQSQAGVNYTEVKKIYVLNSDISYTYTFKMAWSGANYYRIRAVDLTGSGGQFYSPVINVVR